jgi:hypothetical protein
MANAQQAPSLEPEAVSYEALLAAVDRFNPDDIKGLQQFSEAGFTPVIVGVDVLRGIVVRQPDGSLVAGAKIYLELTRGRHLLTDTIGANVKFHEDGAVVVVDEIAAVQRAA